jgi:hypothetical protein
VLWLLWISGTFEKSIVVSFPFVFALLSDHIYFSEFGLAFLDAKERCNARTKFSSWDTSVIEIEQADLKIFLETLCEGAEGY